MENAHSLPAVGFIGTGLMGAPMAQRLAAHGYPLRLWNRTHAKAVAIQTDTVVAVKELSKLIADDGWKAEVLITMLDAGPVVLDIVQKILPLLRPGMVLIDMSSTRQDEAKELALRLKEIGVHMLDCPVSGGVIGAEQGTLALMAGGESGVFARMENLLRVFGSPVLVGGHGSGQLAKLCNQLIVGGTIEIVAEALLLAQAGGADPAAVRTALRGGFAESRILEVHGQRMLDRSFLPGGKVRTQHKDMQNILAAATNAGVTLPVTEIVSGIFADLLQHQPDADHSAAILALEQRNPAHRLGDCKSQLP